MHAVRGFIGPIPQKGKKIHLVGMGISGLLLAWHLKKAGFEISLFSDSAQTGGMIHSAQRTYGLVESAANAIVWSTPLEQLCSEIGIKPLPSNREASKRFILRKGKFKTFPLSALETIRILPSAFKKFPLQEEEDFENFSKRVGGASLFNYLVQPGLYGIYASEARHLGVQAIFPGLAKALNEGKTLWEAVKSLFPGKTRKNSPKGLYSFQNGMSVLTRGITEAIHQDIRPVSDLPLPNADTHVIFCTPAFAPLPDFVPQSVRSVLEKIEYAPLISSTFFFPASAFKHLPQGFGCVIPPSEGLSILGILFNDQIFQHRVVSNEFRSFTCISGGYGRPSLTERPETEWKAKILADFQIATGTTSSPVDSVHHHWPRALPVYSPQLPSHWKALQLACDQTEFALSFFGNYTGEISIRGICASASGVAERIIRG